MWWVSKNGVLSGPFTQDQIEKRIRLGMILSLDRVSEDKRTWIYIRDSEFWHQERTIPEQMEMPRPIARDKIRISPRRPSAAPVAPASVAVPVVDLAPSAPVETSHEAHAAPPPIPAPEPDKPPPSSAPEPDMPPPSSASEPDDPPPPQREKQEEILMNNAISIGGTTLEGVAIASPWRRWSARLFDIWMGSFLASIILGLMLPDLDISAAVMPIIFIPLALCLEGLEYVAFGGTFGKWVFSVKVLDLKGKEIGGAEYWKRLFPVWFAGLGFGIPIVTMITEIWQYRRLKKGLAASYDEKADRIVVQYKQNFIKGLVCVLFILVMIALAQFGARQD